MSEAVEGAALLLYGVSEAYKESANCRARPNNLPLLVIPGTSLTPFHAKFPGLEANYAHQQEKDMMSVHKQSACVLWAP